MHDDVTASQPLDDLVAARHDLDVNLLRVLVGTRLARPDVLHAGAAVLCTATVQSPFKPVRGGIQIIDLRR